MIVAGKILVAYATRNGSTAEIAQAVGRELVSAGHSVDVTGMRAVSSLDTYSAVVIGAPLYMGGMVKDVRAFVIRFSGRLATIPVAAFAVGLTPKNPDPNAVEEAKKALRTSISPVIPVAEVVFAGKLDPARLSFFQRKITELVRSPVGDFRDWDAIAAWAKALPAALRLQ